jgi:16S rRNA (adenine1518-N6/adenine1519-N6)-dimethyltransferase
MAEIKLHTRPAVRDLLDRHGLQPSRALGQNFLCEPGTIERIVRLAGIEPGDDVVEIGPGLGSLTLGLVAAGASVLAVEIDRYLIPALSEAVEGLPVEIRNADARELDWHTELGGTQWKVVANLPYNVATPLILDLLASQPELATWLVMVQREVGERLAADPGTRNCGIPSVLAAYWGHVRVVGSVSAEVFLPRPRVESVLVRLDRTPEPRIDADFARLAVLARAGFGKRRKMLRGSLAGLLTEDEIAAAGVAPTDRAEQLDLDAWGRLARF